MDKILLLFILFSITNMDNSGSLINITEYINGMKIEPQYTKDKIRLAKRITPLMPLEYIAPINRSINTTENLIKIMELKDYLNRDIDSVELTSIPVEDNKERVNKIVKAIKEEVPKSNESNLGSLLEKIINIDKYVKMFEMMSNLMNNQNLSKDTDKLIKMIEPMMKNKEASGNEGNIDIEKIINIMNTLNKAKEKSE